jgi:hypothetical protein
MPTNFAMAVTQRELIKDPAVLEELDRAYARLNGFLGSLTIPDAEADLDDGIDNTDIDATVISRITIASNTDSLDPGNASVISLTPTGATRVLRGIRGGFDGRRLTLYVPSSADQALTLAHAADAAEPNERLHLIGAADLTTVANQARGLELIYDGIGRVWIQTGGSASIAAAATGAVLEGHTQVATGADTSETDLVTGTLPAGTLQADGDVLIVRAYGNLANNTNGKRLKFYWNGTAVVDTNAQGWQDQGWQLFVIITRTGSAAQKGHGVFVPAIYGSSAQPGEFFSDTGDLTGTVDLKVTGTNSTSNAGDIVFEGWTVYRIGAP